MVPVCPYCNQQSVMVNGDVIYPHRPDLRRKNFYLCKPCDAYVGCHPGTEVPLGRLADASLRRAKNAAHAAFDPIWQSGKMKRKAAYGWLSEKLGISRNECHIGMMDIQQCKRVVEVCQC